MRERAAQLLESGEAQRVLGWRAGDFSYDLTPSFFETRDDLKNMIYDGFSGPNLSKYLIQAGKKEGKTAVFLKPCDTLSLQQLINEHRVKRENVYVIGVGCKGMLDIEKMRDKGYRKEKDIPDAEARRSVMLGKCLDCKGKTYALSDEIIDDEESRKVFPQDRFSGVRALEAMTAQQRYDFWRGELSRCIRCNACRNVCPACSCNKCVFDNIDSGVSGKSNPDEFQEKLYHIIRAYHVAGRCTDCGECSRVCPQKIPLHLLNRKFISDIDELYGDWQAGEGPDERHPLINYTQDDPNPSIVNERGGER